MHDFAQRERPKMKPVEVPMISDLATAQALWWAVNETEAHGATTNYGDMIFEVSKEDGALEPV
jgi:hypothetical protein